MTEKIVDKTKMRWTKVLIIGCFVVCIILFVLLLWQMGKDLGCNCAPGNVCFCGVSTTVTGVYLFIPMVIDTIIAAFSLSMKKGLQREGIEIPQVYDVLGRIAVLQIPIAILMMMVWSAFM